MTPLAILTFLGELGMTYTSSSVRQAEAYYARMIADGRVIVIQKDNEPWGILAISICSDITPYYRKSTWEYRPHEPKGHILYVEQLAAKKWDRELRKQFQAEILSRYPQIERAIWHRWAKHGDRQVTYGRKQHVSH